MLEPSHHTQTEIPGSRHAIVQLRGSSQYKRCKTKALLECRALGNATKRFIVAVTPKDAMSAQPRLCGHYLPTAWLSADNRAPSEPPDRIHTALSILPV